MFLWSICFYCLLTGLRLLWPELISIQFFQGVSAQKRELLHVASSLRNLEEILMGGLVPTASQWEDLRSLIPPWGGLAYHCLKELRTSGSSLLPTLKRLRALAESHATSLDRAKARSAQAFAQAFVCAALIPLLGISLYQLLPGLNASFQIWALGCGISMIWAGVGSYWLVQMTESARWGGLTQTRRGWMLYAECAGERFLALVRCGTPPDLAWIKACDFLTQQSQSHGLALFWGHSLWEESPGQLKGQCEQILIGAGKSIKKAVQISMMEGRGCAERVETAMSALRQGVEAQIERELSLLSTRALQPLFIFVAPSILGLLTVGVWISSSGAFGQAFLE